MAHEQAPSASSGQAIVVEGLTRRYGRFTALDGLSFTVERGSIYGFIGPNGAGKTTAMRILATLLLPTEGRAWLAGASLMDDPREVRRHIGYMPDFFGVYDDLTVREYLEFYAQANGVARSHWRRTIDDLLELVDLGPKRDDYVEALSRGMKQRLGLARCLVHDPDVLLLDEPASGLDPRARVELREVLRELPGMGKTVLISSHILPELADVSTQVGIVHRGRMLASGTVEQIMDRLGGSRVLEVRVLGGAEEAAHLLKELPGVGSIDVAGEDGPSTSEVSGPVLVRAAFTGSLEAQGAVLKALVDAGIPVASFAAVGGLEELFMALTDEEVME